MKTSRNVFQLLWTSQLQQQAHKLLDIDFAPACSPNLCCKLTEIDELWQLPLIETVGALYSWKQWAEKAAMNAPPQATCAVDSLIMAQSLAEAGLGVALISPGLCGEAIAQGRLNLLHGRASPTEDCHCFTVSELAANRPGVNTFNDWLSRQEVSGSSVRPTPG